MTPIETIIYIAMLILAGYNAGKIHEISKGGWK